VSLRTSTNLAAVKRIHCTRNRAAHHYLRRHETTETPQCHQNSQNHQMNSGEHSKNHQTRYDQQ